MDPQLSRSRLGRMQNWMTFIDGRWLHLRSRETIAYRGSEDSEEGLKSKSRLEDLGLGAEVRTRSRDRVRIQ